MIGMIAAARAVALGTMNASNVATTMLPITTWLALAPTRESTASAIRRSSPVIVIAADEGPYPPGYGGDQGTYSWESAPDDALRIKFGTLQAIRLPETVAAKDPPIPAGMSPVNTFRLLFDRLFDADLPLLPNRSYTSRDWKHAFDLTDVTERILGSPAPSVRP